MQAQLTPFQRHQLDVIARVTPHAMAGHLLNTVVMAAAVAGSVPTLPLIVWCACSSAVALIVLYRHARTRDRVPRSFSKAGNRATAYAFLLALPWSGMAFVYLGSLGPSEELILVSVAVGMAASGTILLSALPAAAYTYMSSVLVPPALKCFLLYDHKGYLLLGALAVSYWSFLAALISKIAGEIQEYKRIDFALKESEASLQEALAAGRVVAFSWDPRTRKTLRSDNASKILGLNADLEAKDPRHGFLAHLHPEDRNCFAARVKGLSLLNPSYAVTFRFIRPDGQQVWLEETGLAEFDSDGRYLHLKGLTRDITDRKGAEERQQMLVRELDHRVKNVLACVATVAQRTRESAGSMQEFLSLFDGRIQSMAMAHALLSRSHWQGVSLADLVHSELAPCVKEGSSSVEGPEVLISAEATQAIGIVLHELVTNASKYGALSTPNGRISVRWDWLKNGETAELLRLVWTEAGGPVVALPYRHGYGTGVIRDLIPYELGGEVELLFDPGGLRCTVDLPSKWIRGTPAPFRPMTSDQAPVEESPIAT